MQEVHLALVFHARLGDLQDMLESIRLLFIESNGSAGLVLTCKDIVHLLAGIDEGLVEGHLRLFLFSLGFLQVCLQPSLGKDGHGERAEDTGQQSCQRTVVFGTVAKSYLSANGERGIEGGTRWHTL